jgi:meso-butanediol dehydrogenase/(S,S)-butanediol dehydrogenase/diacetyl reductase
MPAGEVGAMTVASGRKALVTGGASGFGLEIARRLRAAGADVALLDLSADRLALAQEEFENATLPLAADVRSPDDVRRAVEEAAEAFGGLDTLVVSAGVIHIKPLEQVSEADWDLTLDVNLKGAFLTAQAAAEHLRRSGRGRIVAISSDAGRRGFSWIQAYCASKFGLIGLVESLAVELAPEQVTVNCICPVGCPTTGMGQEVLDWKIRRAGATPEEIVAATARTNPLGRNATEADIADAVMYFVSDEAAFLTGVSLDVDGGAHLGFFPGAS